MSQFNASNIYFDKLNFLANFKTLAIVRSNDENEFSVAETSIDDESLEDDSVLSVQLDDVQLESIFEENGSAGMDELLQLVRMGQPSTVVYTSMSSRVVQGINQIVSGYIPGNDEAIHVTAVYGTGGYSG